MSTMRIQRLSVLRICGYATHAEDTSTRGR